MRAHYFVILCLWPLVATGCTFNAHGGNVDIGVADLSVGGDLPPVGGDGATIVDMPGFVCTASATSCSDANTLQTCNAAGNAQTPTTCALGCGTDGGTAHCKVMVPTAPVKASDLDDADLTAPAPFTAAKLVFDVSNGQITDAASSAGAAAVRDANSAGTREVHQGIAFRVSGTVAIWSFKGFTVPASTTIVFDNSKANNAAAIVSTTDATIAGTIDVRGYESATSTQPCTATNGGPGGAAGGAIGAASAGAGAGGTAGSLAAGGGGAGFGAIGAAGGNDVSAANAGTAGIIAGTSALAPITGGFGGGFGGANGGGGGGGLQLVVDGSLSIAGVINAGGCGGFGGAVLAIGGGGGGSGGGILAEGLTINIAGTAFVVANGGGGGGGDFGSTSGAAGAASLQPGQNTSAGASGNSGGNGGAKGAAKAGDPGVVGTAGAGGGGGGVGRIRLNTLTGAAGVTGTPLSPSLASGQATQGIVATK